MDFFRLYQIVDFVDFCGISRRFFIDTHRSDARVGFLFAYMPFFYNGCALHIHRVNTKMNAY